jgi:hypothetical protein
MTQADKFKQAVSQHKEEQAARENRGGGFTKIIYAPLSENKNRAFRFTGLPHSVREKSTDCKRIFATMITGDDGKKKFFVVPDPETSKGFLVHRIISKVLSYTWDPDGINPQTGKKGIRIYNYAKSHPAVFNMVFKNGNPSQQYERGWQFSPVILVNVIDRSDMAWHREHKKLKVLSKKVSETSSGALWYERGFPEVLYSAIMEDIVAAFGNWEDYDIVIRKTTSQPFYKAFHAQNDAARFSDDAELLSLISKTGMNAEERSWEGWDFDDLYEITPWLKWQKELGDSFRRIDKELKTTFYEELAELVAKEEDEKTSAAGTPASASSAKEGERDDESGPESEDGPGHEAAEQPAQASASPPAETPARVRQSSAVTASAAGSVNVDEILKDAAKFKGAGLLTAEEKAWITGVDENDLLTWSPEAGELVKDGDTKHLIPEKVHCNPYTGRVYPEVA